MENTKANKLVDNIINNLNSSGISTETSLIDDIKELRTYAIEEKVPLLVKVLRFTYEHIEEHGSFFITIPNDEPLDSEVEEDAEEQNEVVTPVESLSYLIALSKNLNNKSNLSDLKAYKELLLAY